MLGYNYPESEWYKDSYDLLKGERAVPELEHSWIAAVAEWIDPF